jgi:hypothetical protein
MIPRPPLTTVKDCGHVAKTPAQTVVPCIEEALKAKSPFIASFEQAAGGAQTVIGLGGTAPDGVVQVTFDGPAAGATGARVSAAKDCKEPKLTIAAAGSVQVACQ